MSDDLIDSPAITLPEEDWAGPGAAATEDAALYLELDGWEGPLDLLLDLARRELGDNALKAFAFRGVSPAICGEDLHLVLRCTGDALELGAFATDGRQVMLKLTLPDTDDLYRDLVTDPRVMRVLALSGGYTRAEACQRLSRNHGMIASFSRALTEGLTAQQSQHDFDAMLDASIAEIAAASRT